MTNNHSKELMEIINFVDRHYDEALDYARNGSTYEDFDKLYKEGSQLKDKIRRFAELSKTCSLNRIYAYNQELERVGLTRSDDGESITEYANYNTDGSICCRTNANERPFEITGLEPFEYKEEFIEWLRTVHRLFKLRGNRTCGSHLHVSFMNEADYQAICSSEFYEAFCNFIYVFGKMYKIRSSQFFKRLSGQDGDAHYFAKTTFSNQDFECMLKHTRDMGHYPRERYHAINPVIKFHGTVEIRAIPNFTNVETLISFDLVVLAFINTWVSEWYNDFDDCDKPYTIDELRKNKIKMFYSKQRVFDMRSKLSKQRKTEKEIVF